MASSILSEPSPRWGHYSAAVGGQLYVWGGRTEDFFEQEKELSVSVHSFNQCLEAWQTRVTTGKHPPALYNGACTSSGHHFYVYGGWGESCRHDYLYQLDTESLEWSQLPSGPMKKTACGMVSYEDKLILFGGYGIPSSPSGPMKKTACGMVSYEDKLILFGGYGIPSSPTQPGAEFVRDNEKTDGSGRTNELHIFDVQKEEWFSPTVTGARPPPSSGFSLTKVDDHRAALFGGRSPTHGHNKHVYILDMQKMHWSVLKKDKEPWPVGRGGHAAVCLWNGEDHPQLLVTGGRGNNNKILCDTWILDLQTEMWKKVEAPPFQERYFLSATAFSLCPGLMEITLFGGINFMTDSDLQRIANTTVLRFEYQKHLSSAGPPTGEWILTDMADSSQLGTRQRIDEKAAKMIQAIPTSPATPKPAHADSGTGRDTNNQEAERRVQEAEERRREAERRLREAEGRAAEGERRLREAEGRAAEGERRLREAEGRAAEGERLREAEGRNTLIEESLRECEEKLQQLETQWVVDRREIQLTGPELGRGGWATVSVATFRGVRVAAKCIHNQIISDYNIHLFKREMDMAARIRHPNLLQFIGATLEGELIILTELMPTSLRRELESRQGRHLMSLQQVTSIGVDVARALNYLHLMQPHPLIHRDISSANVLLQPLPNGHWRAKVSDYGTVNLFQELQTANPGNPSYSAPEANDFTKQSPKMDIFSFGVLLVEMLTGEFPDSDNRARQLRKISHQPLLALVQRCLSQDRVNRPSASDIISELDSYPTITYS